MIGGALPNVLIEIAEPTTLPLPAEADVEFVGKFIIESRRYIREAISALEDCDDYSVHSEALESVQRSFHTIKANAAALHLKWIERLAHDAESLLERSRQGAVAWSGPCGAAVFQTLDVIQSLLAETEAGMSGAPMRRPHDYIELLRLLASLVEASGAITEEGSEGNPGKGGVPHHKRGVVSESFSSSVATAVMSVQDAQHSSTEMTRPPISVPADKLERLLEVIGEIVTARSSVLQSPVFRRAENAEIRRRMTSVSKLLKEAYQLTMSMRMVRLKKVFAQVARHVRDLTEHLGKPITFEMTGEQIEVDRSAADVLGDALMHIVRNAVDHGIEPADERQRLGKPRTARIRAAAALVDGNVRIELSDDGKGLDRERILAKAISLGLIGRDASLSDEQALQLVFTPGFSTAEKVTSLSGRGVGLDAVRRAAESLRGRVTVASTPGRGCTFQINIPPALTVVEGLLVRIAGDRFVVPSLSVVEVLRPRQRDVAWNGGRVEFVMIRHKALPLVRVSQALNLPSDDDPCTGLWLVAGSGDHACVLVIDELLDRGEFVVKPLGPSVGKLPGIYGTTVLADGSVGLILDVNEVALLSRAWRTARRVDPWTIQRNTPPIEGAVFSDLGT